MLSNKLLSSSKLANAAANAAAASSATVGSSHSGANNSMQSSSAANLTNALINQILELPNVGFLQPLPSNIRDPRFLLSK